MFRLVGHLRGILGLVLITVLPLGSDQNSVVEDRPLLAVVHFAAPLAPDNAVSLLARHGTIVELNHQYGAAGERGGGYFVPSGTPANRIVGSFFAAFDRSIRDMAAEDERLVVETKGAPEAIARRDRTRVVGLGIVGATVAISNAGIASLRNEATVKSIRERATKRTTAKGMPGALAAPLSTHVARSYWVPDLVYTTLTQGGSSHRYAQNYIWWNSGRNLWFGQMGGMEMDVFTNYYDGLAYFTTSDFFGFPSTQMWDSDLPGKYLGNRAFDPAGERLTRSGARVATSLRPAVGTTHTSN